MAWTENENRVLFERARNWATALWNLIEERRRLVLIVQNEATGEPTFADTEIATKAELIALKEVMDSLEDMVAGSAVVTENRVAKLTPFMTD